MLVFFEYLMGRFSTPDELFGPVSIARLKHEDSYSRNIEGFLPTADIVFLDEIWKASSPIQNSLLAVLNERTFSNGNEMIAIPLKCFIAASNEIKLGEDTRAFWDRFLIRLNMRPIEHIERFKQFLNSGDGDVEVSAPISEEEWSDWITRGRQVRLSNELLELISDIRQTLANLAEEDTRYYVSDRRWKQIADVLRASAFFHDREEASIPDSFLLSHCLWNDPEQDLRPIFHRALKKWAFSGSLALPELESKIAAFKDELNRTLYRNKEVTVLKPLKYEGEYLRFIPDTNSNERNIGFGLMISRILMKELSLNFLFTAKAVLWKRHSIL